MTDTDNGKWEELVEAAAKGMALEGDDLPWEQVSPWWKERYRERARIALQAAGVKELVEALRATCAELEVLSSPHILAGVHSGTDNKGIHWDDSLFYEGGICGFEESQGAFRELLRQYYAADLWALVQTELTSCGFTLAAIPVTLGRHEDAPPWEPRFHEAFVFSNKEGPNTPAGIRALAALSDNGRG